MDGKTNLVVRDPYDMKDLLAKQDWIRVILKVAFSAYLLHQIYTKTETLLEREMGFTEAEVDSENMKFPSITLCPGSIEEPNRFTSNKINITADYQNLPRAEDMLIYIQQRISINE